ncbi:MAG: ABC transporter substrate-binding protein, partial [Eggerthellaceae bacterium]|nr:ABC transporter substrate-binding protein [Eggerthellaceae bacterium]
MPFHPLSRRAFLAASALATMALAGCSSPDSTDAPVEVPPSPDAIENGVADALTAALAYEGTDCSPIGTASALFVAAGWHVFEGLYELDMHTYRTEPGLAADVPVQISEIEYEVTLRENPLFSDGTPVTVTDVCNAFARNMANDLYGSFLSFIDKVTVKDEQTIRITLNSPMGILLKERLALVRVFPAALPDEALNPADLGA